LKTFFQFLQTIATDPTTNLRRIIRGLALETQPLTITQAKPTFEVPERHLQVLCLEPGVFDLGNHLQQRCRAIISTYDQPFYEQSFILNESINVLMLTSHAKEAKCK
jgi:hypothetical protein